MGVFLPFKWSFTPWPSRLESFSWLFAKLLCSLCLNLLLPREFLRLLETPFSNHYWIWNFAGEIWDVPKLANTSETSPFPSPPLTTSILPLVPLNSLIGPLSSPCPLPPSVHPTRPFPVSYSPPTNYRHLNFRLLPPHQGLSRDAGTLESNYKKPKRKTFIGNQLDILSTQVGFGDIHRAAWCPLSLLPKM